MKTLLASVFAPVCLSAALSAQVLMLDFGPTVVTTPSSSNSPYHTVNSGFTDTSWNTLNDDSTSLVFASGAAATGVSVNVGASADSATLGTIALGTTPSNSALAGATNTGVYASTSVGRDGVFRSIALTGPSRNVGNVGVQVTGLTAGTYDIYLTGRNTNLTSFGATGQVITGYAGAGTAGADYSFSSYASGSNTFAASDSFTSSWINGENYIKLTVTLASGEALNIAVAGGGTAGGTTTDLRGFLNSVQIVSAIPEPSTYGVLLGLGTLGVAAFARRRR